MAALVLAAGYAYFFSGLRSAPAPLALASASSSPPVSGSPTPVTAGVSTWNVVAGSLARYRVNEVFAGTTTNHEAVAETSDLSGSLSLDSASQSPTLTNVKIVARLTSLHSIDSVAGFNVTQRDRIVQQSLATSQFPEATFSAAGVPLPAGVESGLTASLNVPGQLTIHGVTKGEQATITQLQVTGATAKARGQTTFNMTDFGVQPPALPITSVQPQVTLEFELNLARA